MFVYPGVAFVIVEGKKDRVCTCSLVRKCPYSHKIKLVAEADKAAVSGRAFGNWQNSHKNHEVTVSDSESHKIQ